MPSFLAGPNYATPFGRNQFLRSTQDVKTQSRTAAMGVITSQTIDTWPNQKVLPQGMVMATILTGDDAGKVGPYQPAVQGAATETVTINGSPTGGTFTLTLDGDVTAAIAHNPAAADIQSALEALEDVTPGGEDLTVTGTGPFTVHFTTTGRYAEAQPTLAHTDSLTGGSSPTVSLGSYTDASAATGATDGRGDIKNVVGINNTFLPWQLAQRDVEIAVVVECWAVEAWCLMYDHSGTAVAIDDATADAIASSNRLNIRFA